MKILIIGSKGFIGSHCVDYFNKEHEVWQCDVVTDYNAKKYFLLDPSNSNYEAIFKEEEFDVCINCSGAASVPDSLLHPQRDFILNVYNVFLQLDALRKYNAKCKYINLSSAAVYGNPKKLPITEKSKLQPISPYGIHKKMSEEICMEFYTQYHIKTCSLRIFSAFGPRLKKQLFWDLYKKHIEQQEIILFGTGEESRDFIYITDLVYAIDCVIKKGDFTGRAINIANGKEQRIKNVADTFYTLLQSDHSPQFVGTNREGDPINWVADISALLNLGYSQEVNLEVGLSKYIKWRKEQE